MIISDNNDYYNDSIQSQICFHVNTLWASLTRRVASEKFLSWKSQVQDLTLSAIHTKGINFTQILKNIFDRYKW